MRFLLSRKLLKVSRSAIVAAGGATLVACSALLGLTDPGLDPTIGDGGGGGGDGAPIGDGSPGSNDGGIDAAPKCGSSTDLAGDDKNCGVCGHDCLGTKCTAGVCDPTLVVDNASALAPYDLTLMGGFIYFTNLNSSGIGALAKADIKAVSSVPPASIIDDFSTRDHGQPYQVASTGGHVYFAAESGSAQDGFYGGAVMSCTTTNCPVMLSVPGIDSYAVTTDGTNVVYAGLINDDAGVDRYRVVKSSLALDAPTVMVPDLTDSINYLQISDNKIYIASPSGVFECPIGGCPSGPVKLSPLDAEELSIANGRVYFSSDPISGSPSVQWVSVGGGSPTQVSSAVTNVLSVLADSQYVYIADIGDVTMPSTEGKVFRCPLDGCGPSDSLAVLLSTGLSAHGNPRGLAEDDKYLYWGERRGQIWKVAR